MQVSLRCLCHFRSVLSNFYLLLLRILSHGFLFCAEKYAANANQKGKTLEITYEKFQRVTQALVMRLRQHEESVLQDGILLFLVSGLTKTSEVLHILHPTMLYQIRIMYGLGLISLWNITFSGTGLAGMRQKDLIKWYVEQQNEKNNFSSMEEVKKEVAEVKAIIEVNIKHLP